MPDALAAFALRSIPNRKNAVVVAEEDCEIRVGTWTKTTHCRVVFDVTEFPSAVVEIPEVDTAAHKGNQASIRFLASGFELREGEISGIPFTRTPLDNEYRYQIRFTEPIAARKPGTITRVVGVLYNLGLFSSHGDPSAGLGVLELEAGGYHIRIEPISREYHDVLRSMSTPWQRPANAISVTLAGAGADVIAVQRLLFDIRQFLSFAWGRYIGVALARGFGNDNDLVFAHWGMISADPFVPSFRQTHWFLPAYSEVLSEIMPGYLKLSCDAFWRPIIEWAIYWWLSANNVGQRSETAILASLAGLETITSALAKTCALTPLPLQIRQTRTRGNKGSDPARRIRGLLTKMNMPLVVPGQLESLRTLATQRGWDGAEAVVQIRNALVHPAGNDEIGAAFEASQLVMWYLEMTLLYLFGFNGMCANRTVFEKPWFARERVPWAPTAEAGQSQ